jgi:FixJ family two-component response regulator
MNNRNPIVFVVDDDASVRKGLERLLKSAGYAVESFGSAQVFLDADTTCEGPACLVLDMKMPGLDGFDLQQEILKKEYAMPIVFMTGHGDIPMGVKAIKKGAVDFLTKPFDDDDLLNAIKEAHRKDIGNRKAANDLLVLHQKIVALTPREYEILTYVITGMLNKQIAYDLKISEKTVKVHRGRLMEKLQVNSVAELVRLADKAGIEPADVAKKS